MSEATGLTLRLYENSLGLAFGLLFLVSLAGSGCQGCVRRARTHP